MKAYATNCLSKSPLALALTPKHLTQPGKMEAKWQTGTDSDLNSGTTFSQAILSIKQPNINVRRSPRDLPCHSPGQIG